jgi:hypothetical protein
MHASHSSWKLGKVLESQNIIQGLEFRRKTCPKVLENDQKSLKFSVIEKFMSELENVWHFKCWKNANCAHTKKMFQNGPEKCILGHEKVLEKSLNFVKAIVWEPGFM